MTPQENDQLTRFLRQLTQVPPVPKDSEADALIRDALARQPDAPYLLVQRALLMEQALEQAQAQINRLQGELEQARSNQRTGSFLDGTSWGNIPARPASPGALPSYQQPLPGAPAAARSSGWLGNVATTAAGVVAGSFLFQGLEHLLGGHHGSGSWFGGGDNLLSQTPGETTIVNNYYDSAPADDAFDASALSDSLPAEDGTDDNPSWI